jgi:hypothetical protein
MTLEDLRNLGDRVLRSPHNEVYALADKGEGYRIGVCASLPDRDRVQYTVEVMVQLCPSAGAVDLDCLVRRLGIVERLAREGFELAYEGDGCISCEEQVVEDELPERLGRARLHFGEHSEKGGT